MSILNKYQNSGETPPIPPGLAEYSPLFSDRGSKFGAFEGDLYIGGHFITLGTAADLWRNTGQPPLAPFESIRTVSQSQCFVHDTTVDDLMSFGDWESGNAAVGRLYKKDSLDVYSSITMGSFNRGFRSGSSNNVSFQFTTSEGGAKQRLGWSPDGYAPFGFNPSADDKRFTDVLYVPSWDRMVTARRWDSNRFDMIIYDTNVYVPAFTFVHNFISNYSANITAEYKNLYYASTPDLVYLCGLTGGTIDHVASIDELGNGLTYANVLLNDVASIIEYNGRLVIAKKTYNSPLYESDFAFSSITPILGTNLPRGAWNMREYDGVLYICDHDSDNYPGIGGIVEIYTYLE